MSAPQQQNMKIFGLDVGAEPKKVAALGALLVLLAIVYLWTRDSNTGTPPSSQTASTKAPPSVKSLPGDPDSPSATRGREAREIPGGPKRQGSRQALSGSVKEFKPSLKPDKDNPIDPSKTDPTIRFQELAKVQSVAMAGGGRSLFDFGAINSETAAAGGPVIVKPKVKVIPIYGPAKPAPLPPPPPPIPPPAIPLKFYGFVHSLHPGERRAFFMENDDIYIASEGDMIKKRYKVVKIGVNSAVLEDTQFKNNQQTLKLVEEAVSSS